MLNVENNILRKSQGDQNVVKPFDYEESDSLQIFEYLFSSKGGKVTIPCHFYYM